MKRFWNILSATLVIVGLAGSCSQIKDSLEDCPQELIFKFYRQTGCDTQRYYPADFKDVKVFVFDGNDVLVDIVEENDITLTEDYALKAVFRSGGDFTFVTWAAQDMEDYAVSGIKKGESTKSDLLLAFKHEDGMALTRPSTLYFSDKRDALAREAIAPGDGTLVDTVYFNMKEYTYRISLQVQGLDPARKYSLYLMDDNDRYDAAGEILPSATFNYITPDQGQDGDAIVGLFTELKLEEGRNATLAVWDDTSDELVYTANLVEDLILYKRFGIRSPYNLDCHHDFNIIIALRLDTESATYMAVRAVINDWNLVYRDVGGIQ